MQFSAVIRARVTKFGITVAVYYAQIEYLSNIKYHAHCSLFAIISRGTSVTTYCFHILIDAYNVNLFFKFQCNHIINTAVIKVHVFRNGIGCWALKALYCLLFEIG